MVTNFELMSIIMIKHIQVHNPSVPRELLDVLLCCLVYWTYACGNCLSVGIRIVTRWASIHTSHTPWITLEDWVGHTCINPWRHTLTNWMMGHIHTKSSWDTCTPVQINCAGPPAYSHHSHPVTTLTWGLRDTLIHNTRTHQQKVSRGTDYSCPYLHQSSLTKH